jgi:uncharacterized membrane protein
METKIFRTITSVSMVLTLTAALLSLFGVAITGFYPGIFVLLLLTLIPISSKFYVKKIAGKPSTPNKNYYTIFIILNLLSILVVLWMAFVIMHDRVLHDCC